MGTNWAAELATVGRAPFTRRLWTYACDGYLPAGDLPAHTVEVVEAGRTPHLDPACPQAAGGYAERHAYNDLHLAGTPHACCDRPDLLPATLVEQAALLADARRLTRPYRSARYSSDRRGTFVAPYDNTPIDDGWLRDLIDAFADHVEAHPGEAHMAGNLAELRVTELLWHAALSGDSHYLPVADNDTKRRRIAEAAAAHGWAELTVGSDAQIRWAERIRHDMCTAGDDPDLWEQARESDSAGAWIATWHEHHA